MFLLFFAQFKFSSGKILQWYEIKINFQNPPFHFLQIKLSAIIRFIEACKMLMERKGRFYRQQFKNFSSVEKRRENQDGDRARFCTFKLIGSSIRAGGHRCKTTEFYVKIGLFSKFYFLD